MTHVPRRLIRPTTVRCRRRPLFCRRFPFRWRLNGTPTGEGRRNLQSTKRWTRPTVGLGRFLRRHQYLNCHRLHLQQQQQQQQHQLNSRCANSGRLQALDTGIHHSDTVRSQAERVGQCSRQPLPGVRRRRRLSRTLTTAISDKRVRLRLTVRWRRSWCQSMCPMYCAVPAPVD